jgi:uncharacterized protein
MHFVLFYETVEDYENKRLPFRPEHLALAETYRTNGNLILAGPYADPVDGAMLIFEADKVEKVEAFVQADPYVKNGLITKWSIRKWNIVINNIK